MKALSLLLLAACGADRTAGDPGNGDEALASCDAIAFAELAIPCRVQVAAAAAGRGDEALAERACAGIPEGPWVGECHFRIGEEMARAANLEGAVRHCGRAGVFARSCFTHAASLLAPSEQAPTEPVAVVEGIVGNLVRVDALLAEAGNVDRVEARDGMAARLWFNAYYGTGRADPAAARLAPPDLSSFAATAYALEAVRLLFPETDPLPTDAVERVRASWRGDVPPPTGGPLANDLRVGRYHTPFPVPGESSQARIPVFGGGVRLAGADPEEDLDIAILEALFFRTATPSDAFVPWLDDPRERVRWTAIRLFRRSRPEALNLEEVLKQLTSSADPVLRWHAHNALDELHPPPDRKHRGRPTRPAGPGAPVGPGVPDPPPAPQR
ncbi:MAG: hypothetical protein JXB39_15405 [Deltaproteobacteria bacterium]|nr:hypothetical protein [Deltaproteobacteria bacterium]